MRVRDLVGGIIAGICIEGCSGGGGGGSVGIGGITGMGEVGGGGAIVETGTGVLIDVEVNCMFVGGNGVGSLLVNFGNAGDELLAY